jgi:hypothetical protein
MEGCIVEVVLASENRYCSGNMYGTEPVGEWLFIFDINVL